MRRAAVPIVLLLLWVLPAARAQQPAEPGSRRSTPELIERARGRGELDRGRADLLLAYALGRPSRVPASFRSSVPWDGTLPLLHLRRRLAAAPPSPERDAAQDVLAASIASCSGDPYAVMNNLPSTRFYLEYGTIAAPLNAAAYSASLETAWSKEVDTFGWAAPPVAPSPAPGGRYHVIVGDLAPGLYGYVSSFGDHAGFVGNNPNTSWNDGDAYASCMVLNQDYNGFPSSPQASLDSTTAHELNHSIQFGYGALSGGATDPDDAFVEGGATWMEEEAFDAADDNYNYLWPTFSESMGAYPGSPYRYWITFRGLTERFGTGDGQGGEQVMQDFWELTSQGTSHNLAAMSTAMVNRGTTLGEAYHAYAIAVKFNKACGGDHILPYCFEEGSGYVTEAGATPLDDITVTTVPDGTSLSVEDDYALRWIGLPTSGSYDVTLSNDSLSGGLLRGSVVCDTGMALHVFGAPDVLSFGESTLVAGVDPTGCSSLVAVVTNESQTAPNPVSSTPRPFTVSTASVGGNVTLSVSKTGEGTGSVTSDIGGISCGTTCAANVASSTSVTLTAIAGAGSSAGDWRGGGCSGPVTTPCVVSPTEATHVRAEFELQSVDLVTLTSGSGSGTVVRAPTGTACGTDCGTYGYGTAVRLAAAPDAGSAFTGWSGGGCSGTGPCIVVLTADPTTVTATFATTYDLTVGITGPGSVSSLPQGIGCPPTCVGTFVAGTPVTLSPAAGENAAFAGWGGVCSGTGGCNVTMSADRSVTASFVSPPPPTEGTDIATLDGTGDYAALGGDDLLTIEVPASSAGRTFTVKGGGGNDLITVRFDPGATDVSLRVLGGSGSDRVTVLSGLPSGSSLSVYGGGGRDTLDGAGGPERLAGGSGADVIRARGGRDRLLGGGGRDNLLGGGGADRLNGGRGSDRCRGGAGSDALRSCER